MRFQIEFWWWAAVTAMQVGVPYLAKRAWRLLFDYRQLDWCSSRAAEAWISWGPRFGFGFDVDLSFLPGHKSASEWEPGDLGYGPELRVGFGLGWIDGGFNIPNDNHPDNGLMVPKHYCACGAESQTRLAYHCIGCDEVDCTCELTEPGRSLFL